MSEEIHACIAADTALHFARGELDPAERLAVEHAIDDCAHCRRAVAEAARDAALDPDDAAHTDRFLAPYPTSTPETRRTVPDRPAQSPPPRSGIPRAGERVGRYVIERALGAGGMGVVSLARDPDLHRAVVIKLVRPDVAEGGDALEVRLRREAQAMAQLSHPNVVTIFDIGRHGDRVFLAMELVSGPTLEAWLGERRRRVGDVVAMFRQAGAGLAAAHRAGLVHRDFKPANVMIDAAGTAKVTDFGLARAAGREEAAVGEAPRRSGVHAALTDGRAVIGTPAYMAPEQRDGGVVDARTDQYAFCVSLLDALLDQSPARRRVVPDEDPREVAAALAAAGASKAVRAAIARGLAGDPRARFAAFDELLRALAPPRRRRAWAAAALVGAVAIGGGAMWLATDRAARCTADAPRTWPAATRAKVVAALGARPRLFAAWSAERVAAALDADAEALGKFEIARCEGDHAAPSTACLDARRAALAHAAQLLAEAPPEDPWPLVRAIDACGESPSGAGHGSGAADSATALAAAAALRAELRPGITADGARALAERAHAAGDELLAADAYEAAGTAAFAAYDLAAAERDLRAEDAAGERAGDDAARATALVHLLDLARWTADDAAALRAGDALDAILARHPAAPKDALVAATAAARAFTASGNAARGDAAWERALAAATALGQPDALLRTQIGKARARDALHVDLDGARADASAALAGATAASTDAEADAAIVVADLALAARDGAAAVTALDRTAAARARDASVRIRLARARALAGDVDGALAELAAIPVPAGDTATQLRIEIAHGIALRDGGRGPEAKQFLEKLANKISPWMQQQPMVPLPVDERLDEVLAYCDAERIVREPSSCAEANHLIEGMAPRAAGRARALLAAGREQTVDVFGAWQLEHALAMLADIGAPALVRADVGWERAQLREGTWDQRAAFATAARSLYAGAGKAAQVAAIDAWLASNGGAPPDAGDGRDRDDPYDAESARGSDAPHAPDAAPRAAPPDAAPPRDAPAAQPRDAPRDPWAS